MKTYSFWEQGRNLTTGQIVSMVPVDSPMNASSLGRLDLGEMGITLSAIAQFGIWMEMRKMNDLREAEFEERRNIWIADITSQWIEEHSRSRGIARDVTISVSKECEKMWVKICENPKVDVPQTVLLRLKRMTEYLEWNYAVVAAASNYIVEASDSEVEWLLDPDVKSESIALDFLREAEEAAEEERGDWWQGLLKSAAGLPMLLIPGVGLIAGASAVVYGVGEMIERASTSDTDFEFLYDKLPLIQFGIAASMFENAIEQINYLLDKQEFNEPMRMLAAQSRTNEIYFLLDRVDSAKASRLPRLKSIPFPAT